MVETKIDFAAIAADVARQLLGQPNTALSSKEELRFGDKGGLSVNLKSGVWFDYADNQGGGLLELVARETGEPPVDWLRREEFIDPLPPRVVDTKIEERMTTYDFRDETGLLLFQEVRTERADTGKKLKSRMRQPVGDDWLWRIKGVRRVLYRLPSITSAPLGETVYVVEGPKKADILVSWGLNATCSPLGAGKWLDEYTKFMAGRRVVIIPDNDPQSVNKKTGKLIFHPDGRPKIPGIDHANDVAGALTGVAASVQVVVIPGLPEKGDIVDFAAGGGTSEQLAGYVSATPPWEPPAPPVDDDAPLPPDLSEDQLADGLAVAYSERLRYVSAWGHWYEWEGARWSRDDVRRAFNYSRLVCRDAARLVTNRDLARRIASARTRAAVLTLAGEDPRIAASSDQWDADPWKISTPGGCVDLRTGDLSPSSPDDYATMVTAAPPGGDCPTWRAFLGKVAAGRQELVDYLQRACGYMMTGLTVEHAMFFLYGLGSNGKTTFVETVSGALGGYHTVAQIETFTASPQDRHPTELAGLRGARLVTSTETEEGRRWAESRIKMLTGGDKISARFMRQDFFEFTPNFKLMIFGNHKPGLRSVDDAMRRRMNLLPFDVRIPDYEKDPYLTEKLRAEWGGIIAWMVEGCLIWQERGLAPPATVVNATERYLDQEDTFKTWLEDCCSRDKNAFTPTAWLFASWKRWAERGGEYVGNQTKFVNRLESEGLETGRSRLLSGGDTHSLRGYRGIALIPGRADQDAENTGSLGPEPF